MPANMNVTWLATRAAVAATDRIEWRGQAAPGNALPVNSENTTRFSANGRTTVGAFWHPSNLLRLNQGTPGAGNRAGAFWQGRFPAPGEPVIWNATGRELVLRFEPDVRAFALEIDFDRGMSNPTVNLEVADRPQLNWNDHDLAIPAAAPVLAGASGMNGGLLGWATIRVSRGVGANLQPVPFAINSVDLA